MLSVNDVLKTVLDIAKQIKNDPYIVCDSCSARNCTSARDIYSPINIPAWQTSTRDGFGWNTNWSIDDVCQVRIKGKDIHAETVVDMTFEEKETTYIATGALIPSSFKTVIMVEDCFFMDKNKNVLPFTYDLFEQFKTTCLTNGETNGETSDETNGETSGELLMYVSNLSRYKSYQYIRLPGSDICKGELLIEKGKIISPSDIALMHSVGITNLKIVCDCKFQFTHTSRILEISIISNGEELISPHIKDIKVGEVYDSNQKMLEAMCDVAMLRIHDETTIGTSKLKYSGARSTLLSKNIETNLINILTNAIQQSSNVNTYKLNNNNNNKIQLFISSGGASAGQKDYIYDVLKQCGFVIHTTKVNMMPGKPFIFATHAEETNIVFIGLAGNPVASGVSFYLFVEPFIRQLYELNPSYKIINAKVMFDAKSNDKDGSSRPEYHRVSLNCDNQGNIIATTTGNQASSSILSLKNAHGLLRVDASIGVKCNEQHDIIIIDHNQHAKIESLKKEFKAVIKKCVIGILTASDRATQGIYEDISGTNIESYLKKRIVSEYSIVRKCVMDEEKDIEDSIKDMVNNHKCGLLLTTGGSGPSKRDVTVNVIKKLVNKELPGFGEQMRNVSLKYVKTAILSGQTAGIMYREQGGCMIINLPGSPKSIDECLDAVFDAVPYGVELCDGGWIETDPPAFRGKRK